jgi:hypothetical protein
LTSESENNNEQLCQVCGMELSAGPLVYCSKCKTPHHKDCWDYLGQCSTFACKSHICSSKAEKNSIQISESEGLKIDGVGDVWLKDKKLKSQVELEKDKRWNSKKGKRYKRRAYRSGSSEGGRKFITSPTKSRESKSESNNAVLSKNRYRYELIDFSSSLESILVVLAIGLFWFAMVKSDMNSSVEVVPYDYSRKKILLVLSLVCSVSRLLLSCTYVLDKGSRQFLYYRRFGPFSWIWKVCDFSEISKIGVSAQYYEDSKAWIFKNAHYVYKGIMVLKDRHQIKVCDASKDLGKVNNKVRVIGKIVGARAKVANLGVGTLPDLTNFSLPALHPIDDESQKLFTGDIPINSFGLLSLCMGALSLLTLLLLILPLLLKK